MLVWIKSSLLDIWIGLEIEIWIKSILKNIRSTYRLATPRGYSVSDSIQIEEIGR